MNGQQIDIIYIIYIDIIIVCAPCGERLLGLRVEGRVLDERVDEDGQVVLDLVALHLLWFVI